MIENFPNERRIHCETGCYKNTMEYYGINLSEEMIFGIGGGLYLLFCPFFRMDGLPLLILRSKPSDVYRHTSKRLGISMHEMNFGNNQDKAMDALAKLVDQNIPVTVITNIIHIPYLSEFTPDKMNFSGHNIVIIGREGREYIVADSEMKLPNDDYRRIDEADLRITRFLPGPKSPHGRLFYFDKPDPKKFENFDYRPACLEGLKETCHNMIDVPFRYFGAKGIHYMANQLRKWEHKYSREELLDALYNYYRLLERAGTGGSGYRYLYARFLSQSAEIFQDETLDKCAELLTKGADAWREFSVDVLHHRKKQNVTLNDMADKLEIAADYEYQTFMKIKKEFLKKR